MHVCSFFMKWYIMVSDEIERLRIQSLHDIEEFVKVFAKKYKQLFKNDFFAFRVYPTPIPKFFPYEIYLEIKVKK